MSSIYATTASATAIARGAWRSLAKTAPTFASAGGLTEQKAIRVILISTLGNTTMYDEKLEEMLRQWQSAKITLDEFKAREAHLRQEICAQLLSGATPGTHKFVIEGKHKNTHICVKATRKITHHLDQKPLLEMYEQGQLTAEEENLLRVKLELNLKEYKKTDEVARARLDEHITTYDAMPTLEIEN